MTDQPDDPRAEEAARHAARKAERAAFRATHPREDKKPGKVKVHGTEYGGVRFTHSRRVKPA